jgi:exopolysaccharide biosynthesis WecB/TagA/CpsF family protein
MHDLSGGGVERMRLSLIAALRARGIRVTLIVDAREGPLAELLPSALDVVELKANRTRIAISRLANFLHAVQPGILVSSLDHNNIAALLARRISGSSTRVVICQHNALSCENGLGWKYRIVPWLYWALQNGADGIVAVSDGVAKDLSVTAHIPRRKISLIYNPVVDETFSARAEGLAPHPWLSKKYCPVFVFAGRLTAQKDAFTLLAAMQIALQRRNVRLIMLGEGEDELDLRKFAHEAGIAHAVAFVGFQTNPLPWIRHADALVSSSRYEGLGNAIVEALACGTQVIATDCPHGPAEILRQGRLGRLVPVGDAAALAGAIVSHDPLRFDAAHLRAGALRFSADICAEAHLRLFEGILGRGTRVNVLGMHLSQLRAEEVVDALVEEKPKAGVQLVVTPNLDHVRHLRRPDFAAAYKFAYLACPDGLPVLLYASLRGSRLRSRVTGCDVFARLVRHKKLAGHRLCLVVESSTTAVAACQWAKSLILAERVDVAVAPPGLDMSDAAQATLLQQIRQAAPTILVMTIGAPASEVFIHRYRHALPPCWALCVGQALRVELALARRAPALWQAIGMEWMWRLVHEPRRLLGRYARSLLWFPVAIWRDLSRSEGAQGG